MKVALHSSRYLVEANNCVCHSEDQVDVLLREFLSHQAQRGVVLGKGKGCTLKHVVPTTPVPTMPSKHTWTTFPIPSRSYGLPNPTHGPGFTSVVEAE